MRELVISYIQKLYKENGELSTKFLEYELPKEYSLTADQKADIANRIEEVRLDALKDSQLFGIMTTLWGVLSKDRELAALKRYRDIVGF